MVMARPERGELMNNERVRNRERTGKERKDEWRQGWPNTAGPYNNHLGLALSLIFNLCKPRVSFMETKQDAAWLWLGLAGINYSALTPATPDMSSTRSVPHSFI